MTKDGARSSSNIDERLAFYCAAAACPYASRQAIHCACVALNSLAFARQNCDLRLNPLRTPLTWNAMRFLLNPATGSLQEVRERERDNKLAKDAHLQIGLYAVASLLLTSTIEGLGLTRIYIYLSVYIYKHVYINYYATSARAKGPIYSC